MLLITKWDKDTIIWKSNAEIVFVHVYCTWFVYAHVYLYWHDNTYVLCLLVGSFRIKFNCESLYLTAG